jgi:NMD protein affecting ribosome stability and mRNA decay
MESEILQMFCQDCGKEVTPRDFYSMDTLRIFMITGLCEDCQKEESVGKK